jgi:hypothetical protein
MACGDGSAIWLLLSTLAFDLENDASKRAHQIVRRLVQFVERLIVRVCGCRLERVGCYANVFNDALAQGRRNPGRTIIFVVARHGRSSGWA